jgi:hypothetical protein
MMSTCCSKHIEAWNKYIKKKCVKLVINQNYVKMHGQQNIKNWLSPHIWMRVDGSWRSTYLTNIMYKCCVVSSPRTGQTRAGSQQKESTPNSKLVQSLLIEYKISIRAQISCLSFGSCRLLPLPYALLAFRFVKSDNGNVLQRFLYSNHHLSLDFPVTNNVFMSGVAPPRVREHRISTSVNANFSVPPGLSVRQQQYTELLKKLYKSAYGPN